LLLAFGLTGFLPGDARGRFLSLITWWLGLAYLFVPGSLFFWAWQRDRRRHFHGEPTPCQTVPRSQADDDANSKPKKISQRLILLMAVAAASLLVFCYMDMGHNIRYVSPAELRNLISQNNPNNLSISINVSHYRSIWGESKDMFRSFWIQVRADGKTARYTANVDDATLALLAQKGIACPTYVEGKDFEVLGTPGRYLPFMAAFVMTISGIFLLKRHREERLAGK
jgi:hypothetical protein